jgi:hypothetical protein
MENDTLTLTIRLHDPKEKLVVMKSAVWVTLQVPRSDLALPAGEFAAKYFADAVAEILGELRAGGV